MANGMFGYPFMRDVMDSVNLVSVTSILSPPSIMSSSMDLWGNVKIPYLPNLNDLNSDTWLQDLDSEPQSFSLPGITLGSVDPGKKTTLSLELTYTGLDCSAPTNGAEVRIIYTTNASEVSLFDGSNETMSTISDEIFWSVNTTGSNPP